jgi:protein phosphatase 2C family protein 2/3
VLCCDGIIDRLDSQEVVELAWKNSRAGSIHQAAGLAVNAVMKEALARKSSDNVTVLLVAF